MGKPEFRNPELFQRLRYRDWLRKYLPDGPAGYIVEDLDLVLRVYGKKYGTDDKGKFMFCELKFHPANIGLAQKKTFGLIDEILRKGDPRGERYLGYYVIQYDNEDWDVSRFWINGVGMNRDEFSKFTGFDPETLDRVKPFKF